MAQDSEPNGFPVNICSATESRTSTLQTVAEYIGQELGLEIRQIWLKFDTFLNRPSLASLKCGNYRTTV